MFKSLSFFGQILLNYGFLNWLILSIPKDFVLTVDIQKGLWDTKIMGPFCIFYVG